MQKNMNFAVRDEKTALNLERQEKSDPLYISTVLRRSKSRNALKSSFESASSKGEARKTLEKSNGHRTNIETQM